MKKKRCPGCDVLRPLSEYYTTHRACKKCKSEYYFRNRDAILKQQKTYRTKKQLEKLEKRDE